MQSAGEGFGCRSRPSGLLSNGSRCPTGHICLLNSFLSAHSKECRLRQKKANAHRPGPKEPSTHHHRHLFCGASSCAAPAAAGLARAASAWQHHEASFLRLSSSCTRLRHVNELLQLASEVVKTSLRSRASFFPAGLGWMPRLKGRHRANCPHQMRRVSKLSKQYPHLTSHSRVLSALSCLLPVKAY